MGVAIDICWKKQITNNQIGLAVCEYGWRT